MTELDFTPLKLLATTAEDLSILSAQLQDGLLSLTSLDYDQENKRLTGLVNRFCWEHAHRYEQLETYCRVHSGFCIHHVESVHLQGFHQASSQRLFSLLSLSITEEDPLTLTMICSGDHTIKLGLTALYCQLADLDQPWPTPNRPKHLHEHLEELGQRVG